MSEANILNPTQASLLSPLYGWNLRRLKAFNELRADSGKLFRRLGGLRGIAYQLEWELPLAEAQQLIQWGEQYENDFFTLADYERTRYHSGRFVEQPEVVLQGNEKWALRAVFEELPGLALNTFPSNWSRDAIFLEERNGFAEDLVKLAGTWVFNSHANHHGGAAYQNPNTITTDTCEWQYFGYGFRLYGRKNSNLGIAELSVTRVRDLAVMLAATNIDFYAAADTASAVVNTQTNFALDLYRVKLKATNTKNASSTGKDFFADAIEVMR